MDVNEPSMHSGISAAGSWTSSQTKNAATTSNIADAATIKPEPF